MWERASTKLTPGHHNLARATVEAVQRDRICRGMAETVAELGYAAASVQHVIDRCGVSRRTYYDLFSDKHDCFLATYDEVSEHLLQLVGEACQAGEDARSRVKLAVNAVVDFCADEPALARAYFVEALGAGAPVRIRRARVIERLEKRLYAQLRTTANGSTVPRVAASALIATLHELVLRAADGGINRTALRRQATIITSYHLDQLAAAHALSPA